MATIKPSQFEKTLMAILEEYKGVTQEVVDEAVAEASEELVKELKATAPKESGDYAKEFTQSATPSLNKDKSEHIVYNKKHYRLTHLLEYGHAKLNGGRTEAQPHFGPAEEKAIKSYEKKLKEGLENIDVK